MNRSATVPSATSLTVAFHAYISVDRNIINVAFSFDNASNAVQMGVDNDGTTARMFVTGTASPTILALNVGEWYLLAFTVNSATVIGYAGSVVGNTTALTTASVSTATLSGINKLWVGNNGFGGGDFWNGRVANLRIWDSAILTAAELEQERISARPQRWANLWGWWPAFDDVTAGTDFSGNGRSLTSAGTLTTEDHAPAFWGAFVPSVYIPSAAVTTQPLMRRWGGVPGMTPGPVMPGRSW